MRFATSWAPRMGRYGRSCAGQYILNGAIPLQRLIDDWVLEDAGSKSRVAQSGTSFLPSPMKEYKANGYYGARLGISINNIIFKKPTTPGLSDAGESGNSPRICMWCYLITEAEQLILFFCSFFVLVLDFVLVVISVLD